MHIVYVQTIPVNCRKIPNYDNDDMTKTKILTLSLKALHTLRALRYLGEEDRAFLQDMCSATSDVAYWARKFIWLVILCLSHGYNFILQGAMLEWMQNSLKLSRVSALLSTRWRWPFAQQRCKCRSCQVKS